MYRIFWSLVPWAPTTPSTEPFHGSIRTALLPALHHSHRGADGCQAICHKRWSNWLTVWTLLLPKESHFFVTKSQPSQWYARWQWELVSKNRDCDNYGHRHDRKHGDKTQGTICKRQPTGLCRLVQETQTGALYQPRGVGCGGRWEGGSKGRDICTPMADPCRGWTENKIL